LLAFVRHGGRKVGSRERSVLVFSWHVCVKSRGVCTGSHTGSECRFAARGRV
jgi:hypothetical protein